MITNEYEYYGHIIEIHEHPIYHDFEFVVKSLDKKTVITTSTLVFEHIDDAHKSAQFTIQKLIT
jgi:hypothetical protein